MTDFRGRLIDTAARAMRMRQFPDPEHTWGDADLEYFEMLAEAVIDALGIVPVGWWNDISLAHGGAAPHHGCGKDADVPVFRIACLESPPVVVAQAPPQ